MKIEIKSSKDVHVDGVKALVYGAPGVGKTVLCSTAPNPIIICSEPGLLSIAEKDIPYIEAKTVSEIRQAIKLAKNSDYDTICLDSLSEIAECILVNLIPNFQDKRQAYGEMADHVMLLLRELRDLKGKHVLLTAKETIKEDEINGIDKIMPSFPGKVLTNNAGYLFDEVFYMKSKKKGSKYSRILQTNIDNRVYCKDRSGKLDAEIEPNFTEVINTILGKQNEL